jgi:hypothetical protein
MQAMLRVCERVEMRLYLVLHGIAVVKRSHCRIVRVCCMLETGRDLCAMVIVCRLLELWELLDSSWFPYGMFCSVCSFSLLRGRGLQNVFSFWVDFYALLPRQVFFNAEGIIKTTSSML